MYSYTDGMDYRSYPSALVLTSGGEVTTAPVDIRK